MKVKLGRGGGALHNVTDLMEHSIRESEKATVSSSTHLPFARTWVIYHDSLSSWWSKGAQDYMRRRRFDGRQVRGLSFTNEGNRYEDGLPGDTPEYMPLDSNLFSDLETAVRWNVAATLSLPPDDPRKFNLCTPINVWDAICRTWEYAPTNKRIVQDIERVFDAIDEVVENDGRAVDFSIRRGRRGRDHRLAKRRRRERERKLFSNLEGLHPVSKECIQNDLIDLT